MISIDLHLHTYFSDGKYSPEQLLKRAGEIGLKTIAFTDHENANAARQVRKRAAGANLGIEVIPAVEFTTTWPGLDVQPGDGDIDLLGYFIDLNNADFKALELAELQDISQRISDCCEILTAQGYPLSLEDVLAVNPRFPSLASLIFATQGKGHADSWEAGYRLVMAAWRQVRSCRFEIGGVIETIHAAGGVAVLAHPAAIARQGGLIQAEQVAQLAGLGLDGLEVYHHRNDGAARQQLLALAQQFHLEVSGGSDEHGWWRSRLGTQPVTAEMLAALRARSQRTA